MARRTRALLANKSVASVDSGVSRGRKWLGGPPEPKRQMT